MTILLSRMNGKCKLVRKTLIIGSILRTSSSIRLISYPFIYSASGLMLGRRRPTCLISAKLHTYTITTLQEQARRKAEAKVIIHPVTIGSAPDLTNDERLRLDVVSVLDGLVVFRSAVRSAPEGCETDLGPPCGCGFSNRHCKCYSLSQVHQKNPFSRMYVISKPPMKDRWIR